MNLQHRRSSLSIAVLLLGLVALVSSCQENASSIGIDYYKDTVSYRTDTLTAPSSIFSFSTANVSAITAGGRRFNLNWAAPLMFVGRARQGTEDIEAWGVLRFRTVGADTLAKTTAVRLLLRTVAFKYGPDSAGAGVDFQVFAQEGGGTITDSSTAINTSELTTTAIGSFSGTLTDSSGTLVAIPIDAAEIPKLGATSFAFVIEPGTSMNHVRAFATSDGSAATVPLIEYTIQTDTGLARITRGATLDMHVVRDQSQPIPGEFEIRGARAERVRLDINFKALADSLQLSRFSTVNSARIELHADLANCRQSNLAFDTTGPTVVRLTGSADSTTAIYGVMTRDAVQKDLFTITFGNLIELWLRDSSSNHGLEIRSGWINRLFITSNVGVEDNTLNRWSFYGTDAIDPTKRPRIFVSHSTLK